MATGRGYLSVPHFESVDFDIWLTFNGSYVRSKDTVLFKTHWMLTTSIEFVKI